MPTSFQIPEFLRDYIGLIDVEVIQTIGVFLNFIMVAIVLWRVRNLRDEVAALQGTVQELLMNEQRRSLTEPRATRGVGLGGGFATNPNEAALKLAVTEVELKALRDMVTELRQARDDWKAQAARPPAAPEPER